MKVLPLISFLAFAASQSVIASPLVSNPANTSEYKELFPFQYERWTASKEDTKTEDLTQRYPFLVILRAGTGGPMGPRLLGLRGHYYSWIDFATMQDSGIPSKNEDDKTSARCFVCHSSVAPQLAKRDGEINFLSNKWSDYSAEGNHPVGCANCHDPETMALSISPSWVDEMRKKAGKPVFAESGKEKQSLICGQCHYEGYTEMLPIKSKDGNSKQAIISKTAWKNGLSLEQQEAFLNDGGNFESGKPWVDLVHPLSKTPIIWSIHPDFEIFKEGIHGKNGLECTTCHMPKVKNNGAVVTDHKVGNPLKNPDASCKQCHKDNFENLKKIVADRKDKIEQLRIESGNNLASAHLEAKKAWEAGAKPEEMAPALANIRSAYWRWNSLARAAYFHNPDATWNGLSIANAKALEARAMIKKVLESHGIRDYQVPDFSTKAKALALLDLPHAEEFRLKKCASIEEDFKAWEKASRERNTADITITYPKDLETWYTRECKKPRN